MGAKKVEVITLHTVVYGNGQSAAPKTKIEVSEKEAEQLIAAGAAILPPKQEDQDAGISTGNPPGSPNPGSADDLGLD